MGKLRLEAQRRVEQDRYQVELFGEEKLKEAESFARVPIFNPLEDIAALALCAPIDIAKAIAEAENTEAIVSIFENTDKQDAVESSDRDLLLDESRNYGDEKLARIVYELEHAFD